MASSRLPALILLDLVAYIDDGECENSTTAEARKSSWESESVRVSFFAADPPCISRFSIHVPGEALLKKPSILQSVDSLALIDVTFACGYKMETEYYVYRAGVRGRRPSLEHLRYISDRLKEVLGVASVGILPNDSDACFSLADLALMPVDGQCSLHVFQVERGTWTSKVHLFDRHQLANIRMSSIEKVIALGGGEIGFVDLCKGILAFNILQEKPMPRFVPLPPLLPGNQSDSQLDCSARLFRDVTVSADGSIKCVELEACWQRILPENPQASNKLEVCDESPQDVWDSDVLHDSELMPQQVVVDEDDMEKETYEYIGWRAKAWTRDISPTCWRKVYSVISEDIVTYPAHAVSKLVVSFPVLSTDSSTLYIISKLNAARQDFRVLALDMHTNSLKDFSSVLTERPGFFKSAYDASDLFKHLDVDSDGTQADGDDKHLTSLEVYDLAGPSESSPDPARMPIALLSFAFLIFTGDRRS